MKKAVICLNLLERVIANNGKNAMTMINIANNVTHNLNDAINPYQIKQFTIEPEFNLIYLNYQPTDDQIVRSHHPYNKSMLAITIGLKGLSYFRTDKHPEVCFKAKQTTVTTFSAIRGERCYKKNNVTEQLRLIVGESVLQRYLGEQRTAQLFSGRYLKNLAYQATSEMSLYQANALVYQLYQAQTDPLKLHMHSLHLLADHLDWLLPKTATLNDKLTSHEVNKLEQVRTILLTQYQQPLTENNLCLKVGLNRTKLKSGFTKLYNITPSQMLLAIRMHKAHLLLESGTQVTKTAWLVGYPYANNFSAAFSRYFGYPPKLVFK
jgi:AraC-type DNA-binding domain-containing proteins